jgi:hypothetical protein
MLPVELWELSCICLSSLLSVDRKYQKGQSGDNYIKLHYLIQNRNVDVIFLQDRTILMQCH